MPTSSEKICGYDAKGIRRFDNFPSPKGVGFILGFFSLTVLTQSIDRGVQKNRESDSTSIFNIHFYYIQKKKVKKKQDRDSVSHPPGAAAVRLR